MRMEDLDRRRVVPGSAVRILDDLRWLGLDWEEGPDLEGPHAPYVQSERRALYDEGFSRLRARGLVYPCFCSRKDIAAAASAPQEAGDEVVYPETCRALVASEAERRIASGRPCAWRFRVERGGLERFEDLVRGPIAPDRAAVGDFVVQRADRVPAYQLAVVVDDIAMGMTEVIRGGDLVASTARQILLYRAFEATPPAFGHTPLFVGADGVRLSKRHRGVTLAELRDAGQRPENVLGAIARLVGLRGARASIRANELIEEFSIGSIAGAPHTIAVEPMV